MGMREREGGRERGREREGGREGGREGERGRFTRLLGDSRPGAALGSGAERPGAERCAAPRQSAARAPEPKDISDR